MSSHDWTVESSAPILKKDSPAFDTLALTAYENPAHLIFADAQKGSMFLERWVFNPSWKYFMYSLE